MDETLKAISKESKSLFETRKYGLALKLLEPYAHTYENNEEYLHLLAQAYSRHCEFEKSKQCFMQLMKIAKKKDTAYAAMLNIAIALAESEKYSKALGLFSDLLEDQFEPSICHAFIAVCQLKLKNTEEAEQHISMALQSTKLPEKRSILTFYLAIAEYYCIKGEFQISMIYAKSILRSIPTDPYALLMVGDQYFNMEKYAMAKEYYSKVKSYYEGTDLAEYAKDNMREADELEGR